MGAAVTDAIGRQAPEGLAGIHMNLLLAGPGGGYPSPDPSAQERAALDPAQLGRDPNSIVTGHQ